MVPRQSDCDGLYGQNPACSKTRCRACLGYGVIDLGGPIYRACRGQEAELVLVATEVAALDGEIARTRWWERRRRELNRRQRDRVRRYWEIVGSAP